MESDEDIKEIENLFIKAEVFSDNSDTSSIKPRLVLKNNKIIV